jgi:hypothetical protein
MDNKITIELKDKLLKDKPKIICINNEDECIICSQILKNSTDLVLLNKLCKCYDAVKICEDCFVSWLSYNNECLICRKKLEKIDYFPLQKIKDLNIEIDELSEEDFPTDIRILRNINIFSSIRTFNLWCSINKCSAIKFIIFYVFAGVCFLIIKTYTHLNSLNNSTNIII